MFKHILIPTDGSELSQQAIRTGVELAKFHGARVTGVHAIPDYHLMIAYEGAFDPVTEERIEKEARTRADNYLEFIQKTCSEAGVPCSTVCETSDHPYDAIIKTADAQNCDLILLHSHGRKGLVDARDLPSKAGMGRTGRARLSQTHEQAVPLLQSRLRRF